MGDVVIITNGCRAKHKERETGVTYASGTSLLTAAGCCHVGLFLGKMKISQENFEKMIGKFWGKIWPQGLACDKKAQQEVNSANRWWPYALIFTKNLQKGQLPTQPPHLANGRAPSDLHQPNRALEVQFRAQHLIFHSCWIRRVIQHHLLRHAFFLLKNVYIFPLKMTSSKGLWAFFAAVQIWPVLISQLANYGLANYGD